MYQQESKQIIRNRILATRAALTATFKEEAAQKVCQRIISMPAFRQAQVLGLYWPHNGEVNTLLILEQAINLNKRCYLPVLHPDESNRLLFMQYDQNTTLTLNKYGIPEPDFHEDHEQTLALGELSILFIPLVAFDNNGHRLGMGKGYYDATLDQILGSPRKLLCIGLAYSIQEINTLPQDHWDLQLDGVVTELEFKIFNQDKLNSL